VNPVPPLSLVEEEPHVILRLTSLCGQTSLYQDVLYLSRDTHIVNSVIP